MNFLRSALQNRRFLSRPFLRLIANWVEDKDRWRFEELELEPSWLGSPHDFRHYLDGESSVPVDSRHAVWRWLVECEKVSDVELFQERDYWQHPITFERLRKGDCEDHALWAWRKLGEIDVPARFFVGRWKWDPDSKEPQRLHAWVTFEEEGESCLVECTVTDIYEMVMPFHEAASRYIPHFSVGHKNDIRIYGGFIEYRIWLQKNVGRMWGEDLLRPLLGK